MVRRISEEQLREMRERRERKRRQAASLTMRLRRCEESKLKYKEELAEALDRIQRLREQNGKLLAARAMERKR